LNSLKFYIILTCILISLNGFAQKHVVKGTVKLGIEKAPGINISVKGTTIGTITNLDGEFEIELPDKNDTLIISFLGYGKKEIPVIGQRELNIVLTEKQMELNEVVVTALGIKRDKKSLGYSVQEVSGNDITKSGEISLINSLSGKVAGLSVSATNGSASSSSRIVLRGNNSFLENQALIVVDGVPVDNTTISNSEGEWGGRDYGNGISEINPNDIESISVLKGASAAALYGSRAANGVILISTKKGKKGMHVDFSSGININQAYIHKKFQDVYGAGSNGKFETHWNYINDDIPVYQTDEASYYSSWGPEMTGQDVIDWDGNLIKFLPQPDNYKNYFRTGLTFDNSLAIESGNELFSLRATARDLRSSDIILNSSTSRTNLGLNLNTEFYNKLKVQAYLAYVNQKVDNRPGLSDSHDNVARNYVQMPRHISVESLENFYEDSYGKERTWYEVWNWMTNPYWNDKYELSFDKKNRVFGNISLTYQITEQLNILVRTAQDHTKHYFENIGAYNGLIASNGSFSLNDKIRWQSNTDFLLSYQDSFSEKIGFTGSFGGNAMYEKHDLYDAATNNGLATPYIYSIENSNGIPYEKTYLREKAINSLYGLIQLSLKDFLFMDITGRNDWSSTLPDENNSYFYPSVSCGFVFTNLLPKSNKREKIFPYGKIRGSIAKVGNDTDPYMLNLTYVVDTNDVFGPYANPGSVIPPKNLKPEQVLSREIGADLRFLNNRIGLDFTYYHTNAYNHIVDIDISSTSGAPKALINAGDIQNNGVELQMNIKKTWDKLNWLSSINYTKNNSKVIEITEGVNKYTLLSHWGLSIEAKPGHPYGDIVGYGIKKDENGERLVNENGLYVRTDSTVVLGNINPDFSLSISNTIRYKGIAMSFLLDGKIGGEMFSGSNMYGNGYSGNFVESLEGREEWYASEEDRENAGISADDWTATGGYLAEGVYSDGTVISDLDVSGQENNIFINPFNYWHQFAEWTNEIHEPFIYDASFVKLRELGVTIDLPSELLNKVRIKQAFVSVIGRNLWLIYSKVPNVDPESFHTNGNGQGYELYAYPTRRSIGFKIDVRF